MSEGDAKGPSPKTKLACYPVVLTLAVGALLLMAGCGSNPTADVKATLNSYTKALTDKNATAACGVFTGEILQELKTAGQGSCINYFKGVLATARSFKLEIKTVTVKGKTATVNVLESFNGSPLAAQTVNLSQVGKVWKISKITAG